MKIGQQLYKYIGMGSLNTYIVIKKISIHRKVLYELESQGCNHGFKCVVLVEKSRGNPYYKYVNTVTDDEDQHHEPFHTTYSNDYYYLDKKDAILALNDTRVHECTKSVKQVEDMLAKEVKRFEEARDIRDSFRDNLSVED